MKSIICDIDGTLSNPNHRRHHIEGEKKDWNLFYGGMGDDEPNRWCVEILRRFKHDHGIFLLSGRPERYRGITEDWLKSNHIGYTALIMRAEGDYMDDSIVKSELADGLIQTGGILFVIDDRKKVVDMWREKGFTCLQCAEGDF